MSNAVNTDEHIRGEVQKVLAEENQVVIADVVNGTVILSGSLEYELSTATVERIKMTDGVKDVKDNTTIAAEYVAPFPDMSHHQDTPGSSGAFPVGAFDTSKD